MLATFDEVKDSPVGNIAGECASSLLFRDHVNEATRRLMRRGDWTGTIVPIHTCVRQGCITWPRYVGNVRKLNICKSPLPVKNVWYDFMDNRDRSCCHWLGAECGMINKGRAPVFQDIMADGRYIRAYASVPEDYNKSVRIFGVDCNGQPLTTDNLDGTWSEGIVIEILDPFGTTSTTVRRIDRVLKDQTQGIVRLYAYDPVQDVLEDIARYDPSETNPSYERSSLRLGQCCGTDCGKVVSVVALVKLRFIPVKHGTDLVLIENIDALKDMVQSVKFREQGDKQGADAYESSAVRELNLELADQNPDTQIPVDFGELNGLHVGQMKCF